MSNCVCLCVPQGNAKRKASAPNTLRLEAARRAHEATRGEMEGQARKAARLDKKCGILIAGLQQRDAKLRSQLDEMAQQVCVAVRSLGFLLLVCVELRVKVCVWGGSVDRQWRGVGSGTASGCNGVSMPAHRHWGSQLLERLKYTGSSPGLLHRGRCRVLVC